MDAILERCCGIDVHKSSLTACLLTGSLASKPTTTIKTFSTMTNSLFELKYWLESEGCTHVAIESTGVYWKPVFNILEDSLTVILANARDLKTLPGRKTDVKDSQWIAQLLRCGLIKASFIPPNPIRELRDLTRYRKQLSNDLTSEKNRVQKILQDANIKLSSVATDIFGASGTAMIEALLGGCEDAVVMADLAKGALRNKIGELEQALVGKVTGHHRFMLRASLDHIHYLKGAISSVDQEVDDCMKPFAEERELLMQIPGVKKRAAETLIAEIGVDMSVFPSHSHLASWAGMSPGNNESAGKRHSGKTTHGNCWLRSALLESAWAASRTKGCFYKARYCRLAAKRGAKRASVAIAHSILVAVYHILKDGCAYHELGEDYFDRLNEQAVKNRLVKRLEKMGHKVILEPKPQAA